MADVEEDFSSLPLPDRFQHKIWKVRKAAYEDASKQFEITPDEHDPAFRPFLQDPGLWKGAVADSNVAAQQDGIAALCAFLKFGGREGCTRTRSHTLSPLVEKGLSSTRAATKASALEAILLYIELDTPGPVVEDLLPALSHKQPKIIAATLAALTAIFHNYGCKTVDPKPVLKILPKAFGHADKNVRAEATNLAVEFYRWLREAMKPMFWGELKPTQQTDMEASFEKIKSEPAPKQERFLRSQQAAMSRAPPPGAAAEEEDDLEEEPVEIDAFDLAEPQDVLSKVAADFSDQLASTKWKERKDALEALFTVLNVPRIKDGDFGEVVRGLAKSMKDANIAVVTQAAQCTEVLAKGLRKPFGKYRSIIMGPIMERMKEKKATVQDALGAAVDQVFLATSLTDCLEETLGFLAHKNPQVKEGTMKFLVRALRTTREAPSKPEVASMVESAKKLLSESQEVLRSGGAEILGTIMKIMGERAMGPHLEGLDDIRKVKIKEFYDTAEVKAKDKPKPPPQAAPRAAPAAAAPRKIVGKKPVAKKPAPPPSQYAQEAPLAPQPTARSILGSKLGGPPKSGLATPGGGLKAPMKRTLAGPGGAPAPNLASPRRPLSQAPPPLEEDAPPPPRIGLGRGLAGRSLAAKAPALNAALPPTSPPPNAGMTAVERAELEELRLDKDRLLRQCDDLRQEKSRLNSEVQELKNQNAQLIEDHTRDVLSIKAKETQLVRARSDCEAAEAMCGQLRREMERLKRALTSAERVNSPPAISSPTGSSDEAGIYRDTGMYGGQDNGRPAYNSRTRMSFNSALSEEKENTGDAFAPQYGRSKLSPDLGRNGRTSAASGSGGRNSPAPASYQSTRMSRDASADGARGDGNGVESWKRAAEVTSALKAKIEQMKAFLPCDTPLNSTNSNNRQDKVSQDRKRYPVYLTINERFLGTCE
ncbi:Microtubule-associated protein, microtubule dynamics during spindle orientation, variant 3 [Cadophora gregata]|uniref:Microtubule-associated protein, microtubule dynamics during spindle orientation, variant 3 n=1 Tax=Cadophora gregata TaxID=51156 RepID=UPI0026DBBBDA|nr:Microtubule-associated protein, microtubule dynamics during spindle orientation, variant 3 [Cadophora gregata]KAK0103761.1 Microtubule-associated protein, microtubule dynamics during spindle orientation, variant 3 [Cadophora gregata]